MTFLIAGITKILYFDTFLSVIESYLLDLPFLVPESWLAPAAVILIILETGAGTGLAFEVRGALTVITGQILFFLLILSYAIRIGLDVDCGCFLSADENPVSHDAIRPALYRDLIILAGIIYLFWWRRFCRRF